MDDILIVNILCTENTRERFSMENITIQDILEATGGTLLCGDNKKCHKST